MPESDGVRRQEGRPVIAVDCNGADLGPGEVAAGAAIAAAAGARVLLFGPKAELGAVPDGVEVVDAPVSIAKAHDPALAARSTPDASIVLAAKAVAQGRAQALVCAGGTGSALAAGIFNIKRARGIYRPALAIPLPVPDRPVTLLDVGANAEARREHIVQFAFMGAALSSAVMGIDRPRVGLLSNGEESARGSELVLEAHAELSERMGSARDFEFVGNVEGGDLVEGVADVIVTDGFTGNIALKLMEGVSQLMLGVIRQAAMSSTRGKVGGALLRPGLRAVPRRDRPRGERRRIPARAAASGRRTPWALHPRGLRAGDPPCRARDPRGHRGPDPYGAGAGGRAQALPCVRGWR